MLVGKSYRQLTLFLDAIDMTSGPWHQLLSNPTYLQCVASSRISKALSSEGANAMDREHSLDPNPGRQWSPIVTDTVSHWMALWVHEDEDGRTFVFLFKRPFKFDR